MMALQPRDDRWVAERRDPVNAVAIMYVNDHLETLRAEARQRRAASLADRRSLRSRISGTISRTLGIGTTGPALPKLTNYPYGS
jgi:hypothetical protein